MKIFLISPKSLGKYESLRVSQNNFKTMLHRNT